MRYKVLILLLSFLIASNISLAGDFKSKPSGKTGYLKKDRFDSDRINIYDQNGSRKGYMKQDRFLKDRTYYYDKDGKREGYIEKDRFFKDQTNIFDRDGTRKGSFIKKS